MGNNNSAKGRVISTLRDPYTLLSYPRFILYTYSPLYMFFLSLFLFSPPSLVFLSLLAHPCLGTYYTVRSPSVPSTCDSSNKTWFPALSGLFSLFSNNRVFRDTRANNHSVVWIYRVEQSSFLQGLWAVIQETFPTSSYIWAKLIDLATFNCADDVALYYDPILGVGALLWLSFILVFYFYTAWLGGC